MFAHPFVLVCVCVWMFVLGRVCVRILCMFTCVNNVFMCLCVFVWVHSFFCMCVFVCVVVGVYGCVCVCVCEICVFVCGCLCVYVCVVVGVYGFRV